MNTAYLPRAVFTTTPDERTSSKYAMVQTDNILAQFEDAGYTVTKGAMSGRVKNPLTAKHSVILHHPSLGTVETNGDKLMPQLLLTNSHDGRSAFRIYFGLYRFVCCNGLVVGNTLDAISVAHRGTGLERRVLEGAQRMTERMPTVLETIGRMQTRALTQTEAWDFAQRATALRVGHESPAASLVTEMTRARRPEDRDPTLWNLFNRVQENVMRGGQWSANSAGRWGRLRRVKSDNTSRELNRNLWDLAEKALEAA